MSLLDDLIYHEVWWSQKRSGQQKQFGYSCMAIVYIMITNVITDTFNLLLIWVEVVFFLVDVVPYVLEHWWFNDGCIAYYGYIEESTKQGEDNFLLVNEY